MSAELSPRTREWLAALAHELRSPVGAVSGYAELICDGVLGPVDPDIADAVSRMNRAAEQMLILIQGIEDAALVTDTVSQDARSVPLDQLMRDAASLFRFDLEARDSAIEVVDSGLNARTRPDDALRALRLALSAAVKLAARRSLRLSAAAGPDGTSSISISGSGISAAADDPATLPPHNRLSGAAFRIALARAALARCSGSLEISGDPADIVLTLPALPAS